MNTLHKTVTETYPKGVYTADQPKDNHDCGNDGESGCQNCPDVVKAD